MSHLPFLFLYCLVCFRVKWSCTQTSHLLWLFFLLLTSLHFSHGFSPDPGPTDTFSALQASHSLLHAIRLHLLHVSSPSFKPHTLLPTLVSVCLGLHLGPQGSPTGVDSQILNHLSSDFILFFFFFFRISDRILLDLD